MTPLVLALLVAQAPAQDDLVAVSVTSARQGAEASAKKLAAAMVDALQREGATGVLTADDAAKRVTRTGFGDPSACAGSTSCLRKLAILLGARAVLVSVDVGKVGKTVAIHLEAIAADDDKVLHEADVSASLDKLREETAVPFTLFARTLAAKLVERRAPKPPPPPVVTAPPPPKNDVPVRTELAPAPKPEQPLVLDEPAPSKSRAAPIAVTAVAGAAAVAATVFGVMAIGARSEWNAARTTVDGRPASNLSQAELDSLAARGNLDATLALTSGLVALGAGGVATWLWLR